MNMTPSQQVVAQAQQVQVLQDSDGRRITIRRLGALDRLRLFEAAGPVLSGNDRWLGLAALACSVTEIDGVPLPMSASKASVEAAVQRYRRHCRCALHPGRRIQPGKLSRHPDLVDGLYLCMNGVPFDVAFSLDATTRLAWVVAIGTLKGGIYDWPQRSWKDVPP